MLRGNLATRPFYNERLVTAALVGVACVAVALTAFNGWRLVTLSSRRNQIRATIDRAERETARMRADTESVERGVDRLTLGRLADSTREANDLIDERMFSWTAFFAEIEKTLPTDARIVSVSPGIDKGVFRVTMTVISRDFQDVDTFMDALQGTGSFYDVVPSEQQLRDDGNYAVTVVASYLSPTGPPMHRTPATSSGTRP